MKLRFGVFRIIISITVNNRRLFMALDKNESNSTSYREYVDCGDQCYYHPHLQVKNVYPYYGVKLAAKNISYLDHENIIKIKIRKNELIIPIVNLKKEFLGYQRILNKKGDTKFSDINEIVGGVYPIGIWQGNQTEKVYVCKDYVTGASLFEATKSVILICFSDKNIQYICNEIQEHYPHVEIILAMDFNTTLDTENELMKCLDIAKKFLTKFILPIGMTKGENWNDYCIEKGLNKTQKIIESQLLYFDNNSLLDVILKYRISKNINIISLIDGKSA